MKLMRLFVFNPGATYTTDECSQRTQEKRTLVARELRNLVKAELIKKKSSGYTLNQMYPYLNAVERFLTEATPITERELTKKLAKAGSMKLVTISGVFLHDKESRVDLMVVGDHIRKSTLTQAIASVEAELGREIRYAYFETPDFHYRLGLYDKLVRDILDFNHKKIVNKLGV